MTSVLEDDHDRPPERGEYYYIMIISGARIVILFILIILLFLTPKNAHSVGLYCDYCHYICCQWAFSYSGFNVPNQGRSIEYTNLLNTLRDYHGYVPCSGLPLPVWKNGEWTKEYFKCAWTSYVRCKRSKCSGCFKKKHRSSPSVIILGPRIVSTTETIPQRLEDPAQRTSVGRRGGVGSRFGPEP